MADIFSPDKPVAEALQDLSRKRLFDDMVRLASACIHSPDATGEEKFSAIRTLALYHQRREAALPLLDVARQEMEHLPGHLRAALAHYEETIRGPSSFTAHLAPRDRSLVEEVQQFMLTHPVDSAIDTADRLMAEAIDARDVERRIIKAVLNSSPLSLVRMGDGEGRFAYPLDSWPETRAISIDIAKRIWLRNSQWPDEDFWETLRDAYRQSDIVGVNPAFRIELEYRNSPIGYVGVVNGNRLLADAKQGGTQFGIVPNWIFGLVEPEFFRELCTAAGTVNVIGPHPGMEGYLKDVLGAETVHLHLIPADDQVPSVVNRPHFPDVYEEVLEYIRGGAKGLWLVSAGAYAKIYCNEIRKAGGVGLDIGSTSDSWMNMKTR